MSDGQEQPDKLDTPNARKGGPLTDAQREAKQKRFLKAYRESGIIKHACKAAGISRQTFYDWRDHDEAFKIQLPDATLDAHDTLEIAAYAQAVLGVEEPVVSMGQVVYEYHAVLDTDGNAKLDSKGKPIMKRGKMVTIRKYAPSLLQTLLKANMPEKYKDKSAVEHSGKVDITGTRESLMNKLAAFAASDEPPESE